MDQTQIEQLKKFSQIFNADKIITSTEIQDVLEGIVGILLSYKRSTDQVNEDTKRIVSGMFENMDQKHVNMMSMIDSKNATSTTFINQKMGEIKALITELKKMKQKPGAKGDPGKDADETVIVDRVLAKMKLPEYKPYVLTGEEVVASINALDIDDPDLQIDWKHIKNVPKSITNPSNGGGWVGSPIRYFSQMEDFDNTTPPTNGQVPIWNSTTKKWTPGSGGGGGGGTWGSITGTLSAQTDLQSALDAKYDASNPSGFITSASLSGYVPFTGSLNPLDLGSNAFTTTGNVSGNNGLFLALVRSGASSGFHVNGRSKIFSSADGLIELFNNAGTGFTRLNFGGLTASFPSIRVSGAALNFRLADDSADAAISASNLNLSGSLYLNADNKARISGNTNGVFDFNYNTTGTGGLNFWGGGVSKVWSVDSSGNVLHSGSLGSTGARIVKVWTTDLTVTNAPTFDFLTSGSIVFGGSSGVLSQDNSNLNWDNTNKTIGIGATASSTNKFTVSDTVLAGSGALSGSLLNFTQTWNTSGSPTSIKLNVTNTASGSSTLFLDFQISGVSYFKVAKDGSITTNNGAINLGTGAITTTGNVSGNNGLFSTSCRIGATGQFYWNGRSMFKSSADGAIEAYKADGTTYSGIQSLYQRWGSGSPESAVSAPVGAIYHRTDGGAGTSLYVKESGTGNTGWVAK